MTKILGKNVLENFLLGKQNFIKSFLTIIVCYIAILLWRAMVYYIATITNSEYLLENHQTFIPDKLYVYHYLIGILFIPLIENCLIVFLIYIQKKIARQTIVIISTAIIFSLLHSQNIIGMLMHFFSGVVFSWIYVIYSKISFSKGFRMSVLMHTFSNSVALLIHDFG